MNGVDAYLFEGEIIIKEEGDLEKVGNILKGIGEFHEVGNAEENIIFLFEMEMIDNNFDKERWKKKLGDALKPYCKSAKISMTRINEGEELIN